MCSLVAHCQCHTTDMSTIYIRAVTFIPSHSQQPRTVPLSFGALGQLDRIIVARLQLENNSSEQFGYHAAEHGFSDNALLPVDKSLVDYLVRSWIRADELKRSTNALRYPERVEYLSEIQTLCVSYAGLLLQMPDMFPQPAAVQALGSAVVVPKLVADPEQPHALPSGFLVSLVARFAEEGLAEIAGPWINGLSADMRAKTMCDDYMPPLRALGALMNYKPIATLVTSLPAFNPPGMTARVMELASVLGPFFRLSPLYVHRGDASVLATNFKLSLANNSTHDSGLDDPKLAASHFGNAMQRTRANVDSAWTSLRLALNLIQQELFQISMAIVRASPESKEALLDWFATVLRKNEGTTFCVASSLLPAPFTQYATYH